MGIVMIRCPETRKPISTGVKIERAAFNSMPVFFSRTLCPVCKIQHEWFAKDAWVCDPLRELFFGTSLAVARRPGQLPVRGHSRHRADAVTPSRRARFVPPFRNENAICHLVGGIAVLIGALELRLVKPRLLRCHVLPR